MNSPGFRAFLISVVVPDDEAGKKAVQDAITVLMKHDANIKLDNDRALFDALDSLVSHEGTREYVYLDKGIGTSTASGKRWMEARTLVKTRGLFSRIKNEAFDSISGNRQHDKPRMRLFSYIEIVLSE
jgi:hypothetical protein